MRRMGGWMEPQFAHPELGHGRGGSVLGRSCRGMSREPRGMSHEPGAPLPSQARSTHTWAGAPGGQNLPRGVRSFPTCGIAVPRNFPLPLLARSCLGS
ncbi:hypothetical protein VFPBJ_05829 [Purpureocillium lilacinum]|uniref:Uncharacterized protein n=1 Tax=Purpureocillium lilacinum TaxID=33203 RepID=A0A179GQT6_PURLI|nr:hypothetical protein VFPBJ_05829 [Purpureocillium lilacinum]